MDFFVKSNGRHTEAIIDGVLVGRGIKRLDFSADGNTHKSTVRMDFDVEDVLLSTDERDLQRFFEWAVGSKMLQKIDKEWKELDQDEQPKKE